MSDTDNGNGHDNGYSAEEEGGFMLTLDDPDIMDAILNGAVHRTRRLLAEARAMLDDEFGADFARNHPVVLTSVFDSMVQAVEADRAALWDDEEDDEWEDWDDADEWEDSDASDWDEDEDDDEEDDDGDEDGEDN